MDFGLSQNDNIGSKFYLPSASDCMRCGLCLNSCPTYSLFKKEAETPRYRIRTIDKILNYNQAITTEEQEHLDNCLQCRACEPVCPSKMAYGELFDETQRQLARPPSLLAKIAFWFIEHKQWLTRLMPLACIYFKSGIWKPLRKSGLLKRFGLAEAEALLVEPALHQLKPYYPSKTLIVRGRVGLFTGCIAEHFDRDTLKDVVNFLTTIGFDVFIPTEQSCCGAIHQHNGRSAEQLIGNNLKVFSSMQLDAVIYTATGCGAMLNEYRHTDSQAAESFTQHLFDLNDFLLKQWPEDLKLNPAHLKIAVHEPCSQRNVLKNQQTTYKLLEKIPGLNIRSLPDNHLCCGAGGSYMLTHPENAAALRQKKIQLIDDSNADLVASSNFGCALFLNKVNDKVIHPVRLLARQLPSKS
ncbi:MAG: (Fe-S)-binding protein [Methylococcaceae bacterium]|nr:(Fe-S)-binding protein [Methylococcaceae bacterium]